MSFVNRDYYSHPLTHIPQNYKNKTIFEDFMAHVKKHLQVGVWKIIEEFSLASATGKYRLQAINTSLKSPTIIQSPIHLSNLTIIFFYH